MEQILNLFTKDMIVGVHTIDNSDEDMYSGKIIKYEGNLLYFLPYDIYGEECDLIKLKSSDIACFETNSADTEYISKVIANKDKLTIKKEKILLGNKIRENLKLLYENKIPALYCTYDEELYAYVIGFDENTIVLHTFSPYYNTEWGITCFPIKNIEKVSLYSPELNVYPYIYKNCIKVDTYHINSKDICLDFFSRSMNEKILINVSNSCDIKNNETLVGYVESIKENEICFSKVDEEGKDCGYELYKIQDIQNFGCGGLYLDKIEILYTKALLKKAMEESISIRDFEKFMSALIEAKEKETIVSLIFNETEEEYYESTGFILNILKDWIHLKIYDDEENHWFECFRRIQDFRRIKKNGTRELLIKNIFNSQKHSQVL